MSNNPMQPQGDMTQVIRERTIPVDKRSLEERAKEFDATYGPDLVSSAGHNGVSRVSLSKLQRLLCKHGYYLFSDVKVFRDPRFIFDEIKGYARISNKFIEVFVEEDIRGAASQGFAPYPGFSYARFDNATQFVGFVQDYQNRDKRFSKGKDVRARLVRYPWCDADNRTKIQYALGLAEPPLLQQKESDAQVRIEEPSVAPA